MTLTPLDIVTMLERDGALATPDDSPWPTHEGDVTPVDWTGLFPTRGRGGLEATDDFDQWEPPLDDDFLGELDDRVGNRPPADGPSPAGGSVVQPDVCAWY